MNLIKLTFQIIITILLLSSYSQASGTDIKDKFAQLATSNLGVQASNAKLDDLMSLFTAPPVSKTGKSLLTVNKMGYDVLDHTKSKQNWLLDEFKSYTTRGESTILDVGCGYGNIALNAIADGNIVIANDIAPEHLIEVRRRAIDRKLPLQNLYLNDGAFPYELKFEDNSLDYVVLHRVLHFLTPQAIKDGFTKIHKWLKPNGKLFIVVMAPQNKSFSEWFLPIYNERWEKGDEWPGKDLSVAKALPDQEYNLPATLHVMDERPLEHALKKHGFTIEKIDFIDMKHFGKENEKRDGHEAIGVIATKK